MSGPRRPGERGGARPDERPAAASVDAWRAAPPPVAPAAPGGLVVVHAHPDDETLSTGALLAAWAAAGLPVTVVTATRGERGEVIPPALRHLEGDGPALAAHRTGELAAALAALGVTDHAFLDALPLPTPALSPPAPAPRESDPSRRPSLLVPERQESRTLAKALGGAADPRGAGDGEAARYEDSGMVWVGVARAGSVPAEAVPERAFVAVPLDEAAHRLAALLRARRPAVVATYDPDGGYGHPDHVRVHEVTMRALQLVAADGWTPTVLWRRTGRAALAAAYQALAGERVATALDDRPDLAPGDLTDPVLGDPAPASLGVRPDPAPGDLARPDPAGPFPAVAVPDDAVDLAVDTLRVRDRVLVALVAHATQVQAVRRVDGDPALVGCYALSDRLLAPLLPEEGYALVAGPDPVLPAGVRRLP